MTPRWLQLLLMSHAVEERPSWPTDAQSTHRTIRDNTIILFLVFIYWAALDLSCGMWVLLLWHTDSLVVAPGLQSTWVQLPHGMWDFSSLTRGRTPVHCIARRIPNHWTTREVPKWVISHHKVLGVVFYAAINNQDNNFQCVLTLCLLIIFINDVIWSLQQHLEVCGINPHFTNEETEAWKACLIANKEHKQGLYQGPFLITDSTLPTIPLCWQVGALKNEKHKVFQIELCLCPLEGELTLSFPFFVFFILCYCRVKQTLERWSDK